MVDGTKASVNSGPAIFTGDPPISAADLPAIVFGLTGVRISDQTARAWLRRGCRNIRLPSKLVGGKRVTNRPALEKFLADVAGL